MYLNCHSYFSFKYGIISPEELLREAQQKDISCLALTDINNTSGILDFFRLAPKYNIKTVAGIDFRNGPLQKFIGLAKNHEGFYELNKHLSNCSLTGQTRIPETIPQFENAFVIHPFSTPFMLLAQNEFVGIKFSDLTRIQFSKWKNYPDKLLLLSPVTFRSRTDFNTHRLLRAVDKNTLLSKLDKREEAQPDEMMYPNRELKLKLGLYDFLLKNTMRVLEQCDQIDFQFTRIKNKKYFTGNTAGDRHRLESLCEQGLLYRYNGCDQKRKRMNKELGLIYEKDFAAYFLITHEMVEYARSRNFFYVGRGSGANSMVAYLLGITDVDPVELDLYFERFINPSRINPPDFDIDFSSDERDEIVNHMFERHGREHTALLATYNTFQSNAVLRELGKVFGLPKDEIDMLPEKIKKGDADDHITRLIFRYSERIHGLPNHLSIHAGGILISEKPMCYYTAVSHPPKNFPLTQFSMIEAEDVGLYKFDVLAQRGLGKIRDAVEIIKQNRNEEIDIHDVKKFKEDERVRENLQNANLMGCFYVESPAMRMLLKKLEAKTYPDLVAASSIIRPGVASSGMMREYILRFKNETPTYETPKPIYDILYDTYGVMVYQEDVIKVAHFYAGLTLEEADVLRRGMSGKYRGREEFAKVEQKFFSNCKERGYDENETKEVWRQIESFAGYAFSKGHSASYAVESYQCMYLKTYFYLEYMVAVLNNGGGFYATEFYVHEARQCGANIHAPDMNMSEQLATIYQTDIYLGFNLIAELEINTIRMILNERNHNGKYLSLEDFSNRVSISLEQIRLLIRANAFRFTGRTKQQLLWDIHMLLGAHKKSEARHYDLFPVSTKKYTLPELYSTSVDEAWDAIELFGFPLCSPFDLLAPFTIPEGQAILTEAAEFSDYLGKTISIIGYLVTRKHTHTKNGHHMAFGTFLDKNGKWIDTTHFPNVFLQFPFRGKGCYLITGKVVEEFNFYSIEVTELQLLHTITREEAVGK